MKKLIALLILTISITSCSSKQNIDIKNNKSENNNIAQQEIKAEKIEIVFFHATHRCFSCNKMEELSKKTLEENFKNELDSGKITFTELNGELPENKDMVIKYRATGLSIFINSKINGKDNIKEEKDLWRYIQDEELFKDYLTGKLTNLLSNK